MLCPAKSLSTRGACMPALICVSSPVPRELRRGGKSPGAVWEIAWEGFLASMEHHVLLQPGGLVKLLEAYVTLKGWNIGVAANVGVQCGLSVVCFLTVWHWAS